jgi:hypothetical protein
MVLRRIIIAAAVLLIVGLGAAGCSASGGTSAPDTAGLRPFQGATYYSPDQRALLRAAEERLLVGCMARKGFSYRPQTASAAGDPGPMDVSPYALVDPAQARVNGFGIISAALDDGNGAASVSAEPSGAGWSDALEGTASHRVQIALPDGQGYFYNSDSCLSSVDGYLYGAGYQTLYDSFQVWTNQVVARVLADPRYQAAQRRWAACMKAARTPYSSLSGPTATVYQELDAIGADHGRLQAAIRSELRLAVVDAACQQQARLGQVVAAVQDEMQSAVLGKNTSEVGELLALRRKALTRAASLTTSAAARPAS